MLYFILRFTDSQHRVSSSTSVHLFIWSTKRPNHLEQQTRVWPRTHRTVRRITEVSCDQNFHIAWTQTAALSETLHDLSDEEEDESTRVWIRLKPSDITASLLCDPNPVSTDVSQDQCYSGFNQRVHPADWRHPLSLSLVVSSPAARFLLHGLRLFLHFELFYVEHVRRVEHVFIPVQFEYVYTRSSFLLKKFILSRF